ncbi:MAG: cytochrome-c peroxidase, partial [Bryobacterales bacterium]|nr:cytochrome-c peroxidase [Bryobacterales bacterium]
MRGFVLRYWIAAPAVVLSLAVALGQQSKSPIPVPLGLLPVQFPKDNPYSPAKAELGKLLYFDVRLSGDNSVSCATCHAPQHAYTDGKPVSTGIRGQKGGRSAPTIWNAAWNNEQFWDGRAKTLEDQAKGPIANPIEMDQDPKLLLTELRAIPEYTRRFDEAFRGANGSAVTLDNIASAIAAFERSVATVNSPFDRYAAGDRSALSDSAVRGLNLFRSVST